MTWKVIFSEPFGDWWESLSREERISVGMYVDLLRTEGVTLRAPYSSGIQGSRYGHMRELRIQHKGHPYRVLYAFDPRRSAVLLLGGDKTGNDRWYEENVPRAEKIYDEHLKTLESKGGK